MKKITILALHLGFGGVEKYFSSLCKMLESDFEIEIISTYKLYDKPGFDFSNKIKITYLIDGGPNRAEFKSAVKNKNIFRIIKEGIKSCKILYQRRNRNKEAIKRIESDYIISSTIFQNKLISKYAKKGIINIATEHNYHNNDEKYISRVLNSIKGFDYFIPVSQNLQNFYKKRINNSRTKCVYIPNVLDELPSKRSKSNNKNLLCVGRLSAEKGQKDLIEVMENLIKIDNSYKLTMVGGGPEQESIETLVDERGLQNVVEITGFLKNDEVEKHYLESSMLLLPSHTESFGMVLIEAMSYGLPCIAFDCADGARTILADDRGILIPTRDKDAMVQEIIKLSEDEKRRREIIDSGLQYCEQYLASNVKKNWLELLGGKYE